MSNVPVGPSTQAGLTFSAAAFVAAVVAAVTGHGDAQSTQIIIAGVGSIVTLAITLAGRYAQAHKATTPDVPADAEGPGDPDALPHLPVTDPAAIPPDQGDAGA